MGTVKGWMLKQKTETETIWENRGIPQYSKIYHRVIHVGHGTELIVEKKSGRWLCIAKGGTFEINKVLESSISRTVAEKKCERFMRAFPQG